MEFAEKKWTDAGKPSTPVLMFAEERRRQVLAIGMK